jgi:uncharacterized membrane protein YbhN (UPF0104 family)
MHVDGFTIDAAGQVTISGDVVILCEGPCLIGGLGLAVQPGARLRLYLQDGLSVVGASYQALLRNPLAEPYILGVSGGAAFGATLVIALGLGAATALGATLIPVAAFLGGLGATVLVVNAAVYGWLILRSRRKRRREGTSRDSGHAAVPEDSRDSPR